MSNFGLDFGSEHEGAPMPPPQDAPMPPPPFVQQPGYRRAETKRGRRWVSCLPLILVLALLAVLLWFGGRFVIDKISSLTGGNEDYSSTAGTAPKVTVEVHSGDNAAAIGRSLKAADVVKSVGAFVDAAAADDRSLGIQVGYYSLNTKMKASAALEILVNPKNLIQTRVVVPEGARKAAISKAIVKSTDFTKAEVRAAMNNTQALGLPPEANGDPEGYLFPATYSVVPGETAAALLKQMVDKTKQVEKDLDITAKAKALGFSVSQIMTIASILEYEASRDQDYPKVARAIYNRLDIGMALQSDATVAFANNLSGTLYTSDDERAIDSPYNTYKYTGLPPGPIGSPGETTIKAALNPATGPWLYWVVVNLKTGETRFNSTLAGHNADVAEFRRYCETSDAC